MIRIKTIAVICASFVIFFACYNSYNLKTEYKLDCASEEFIKQDYASAQKLLRNLKYKISATEYHLYTAYIQRDLGALESSNKHLKKAEEGLETLKLPPKSYRRICLETHLNRAFNAYLQKDYAAMSASIQKAKQIKAKHIWVRFFSTIEDLANKNYASILEDWQEQPHVGYLSPWMRKAFGDKFDFIWYSIRACEAKIALGNQQEARTQLQSLVYNASSEQQISINFLIGLSFLKEAELNPESNSNLYYKEAIYYLSQVPVSVNDYQEEFLKVINSFHSHTQSLIASGQLEDIPFYTQVLSTWSEALEVKNLERSLLEALYKAMHAKDWLATKKLAQALNPLNLDASKRQDLELAFLNLFQQALSQDCINDLDPLYENLHLFTANNKQLTKKIANSIAVQIFDLLPIDTSDLFLTTPYFEFWMRLDDLRSYRYLFADQLIHSAVQLWSNDRQADKALAVFNLGSALPYHMDQSKIHQTLSRATQTLFEAERADQAHLRALKNIIERYSPQSQENLKLQLFDNLKDSALLTSMEEDEDLEPLSNTDPQDRDSENNLLILGLMEYYEENYEDALNYLHKVQTPGLTALKALAISEMLAGDYNAGYALLQTFASQFAVSNEDYQRLGFAFLLQENPTESLHWFSFISPTPPEVVAGKCLAFFQAHRWKEALNEYHNLPNHFKMLPGLQRVLLETTAALGDFQSCSLLVNQILESTPQAKEKIFSNHFLNFKRQYLDDQTAEFIVGMYFYKWKHETAKALEYFQKIPDPSSFISLSLAKILCEEKKYQEAYDVIVKAYPLKFIASLSKKEQAKALPLLAEVEGLLGYSLEAAEHYACYYNSFPWQIKHRKQYAQILMHLGLYQEAIIQWAFAAKHQSLSPQDKVLYVECMVRLNQFKFADKTITKFLAEDPEMPLENQLEMAKYLYIIKNQSLLQQILAKIPEPSQCSTAVQHSLLNLWIHMGEYAKASMWIEEFKPKLQQTFDGLLLLATFETRQGNFSEALKFAGKAEKMQAYYHSSLDALIESNEMREIDLHGLKQKLSVLQIVSQVHPMIATLKLEVAKKYLEVVAKTPILNSSQCQEALANLNQAYKILTCLIDAYPDVPQLYVLLGKYHALNLDWEKAKDAYEKALSLNPSCMQSLKSLSYANRMLGNKIEAYADLETALIFLPADPVLWQKMGEFYLQDSCYWLAAEALQQVFLFQPHNQKVLLQMAWARLYLQLEEQDPVAVSHLQVYNDIFGEYAEGAVE